MGPDRYLLIWDRIGDYHRARIRAFETLVGKESVFTADLGGADTLYGWQGSSGDERHSVLSVKPVDELDMHARVRAFSALVRNKQITCLAIAGYAHPEYLLFLVLGKMHGCRIVLFAESWYGRGGLKNRLKGWFLRCLVDSFFLSGSRALEHFINRLRIPASRTFTKYSVVDNEHFSAESGEGRNPVLLCVARFSPEKNLDLLIQAFQKSELAGSHALRIIGGGPERTTLEALVDDRRRVELIDWVAYDKLPLEYGRAKFFILPSRFEPWGLVVNEALASGLPVIASEACGCAPDLITEQNGFTFPEESEESLVRILDGLPALTDAQWQEMSAASRAIIAGYSCPEWAEQLKKGFSKSEDH